MNTFERLKRGFTDGIPGVDVDATQVTEDAQLRADLNFDSLDEVALELWIETEFGLEVPSGASDDWRLVSDVVAFIDRLVASSNAEGAAL